MADQRRFNTPDADDLKDPRGWFERLKFWFRRADESGWCATWPGFVFPGPCVFDGEMGPNSDMEGARFLDGVSFERCVFRHTTTLDRVAFENGVNLQGAWFAGDLTARKARLIGDCNAAGMRFLGPVEWAGASFRGPSDFREAIFAGRTSFRGSTFEGLVDFSGALFNDQVDFRESEFRHAVHLSKTPLRPTIFRSNVSFDLARFLAVAFFDGTALLSASFEDAEFERALFIDTAIGSDLRFRRVGVKGLASLEGIGRPWSEELEAIEAQVVEAQRALAAFGLDRGSFGVASWQSGGPRPAGPTGTPKLRVSSPVYFTEMPMGAVSFRDLDPAEFRFEDAWDLERLIMTGQVEWPQLGYGYRVADHTEPPNAREVERIYRGLRKNLEDRGDRVGAHRWFWSEMEVGRRHSKSRLTRVARAFYHVTSDYGFSVARPIVVLLIAAVLGFAVYQWLLPAVGSCPVLRSVTHGSRHTLVCPSASDTAGLVGTALLFQSPPGGLVLAGVLPQVLWAVLKLVGAGLLISVGIAFRNQVAR